MTTQKTSDQVPEVQAKENATLNAPEAAPMKKRKEMGLVPKMLLLFAAYLMVHAFVKSMIDFRALATKSNVPMRDLSDLWLVLLATVFCALLKFVFDFFFKQSIIRTVQAQNVPDAEAKIKKCLKQGKDIFYYGILSVSPMFY